MGEKVLVACFFDGELDMKWELRHYDNDDSHYDLLLMFLLFAELTGGVWVVESAFHLQHWNGSRKHLHSSATA